MFLIALLLVFTGTSHAAKMDKEFGCFMSMNQSARAEDVVMDNKLAVHPLDGFSFYALTKGSVQKCRVPAKASLAPEGREGVGPWLVKITDGKVPYHFQYPQVREHLDLKGSPAWLKPECTGASDAKSVAKILENRIADSRQVCGDGPDRGSCLADFVARLKNCEGIPAVKDYVMEIGRSASMHATPPLGGVSNPQIGR